MNDLQQLIQEITRRLDSNDLTNVDLLRGLAEDYVKFCNSFNQTLEECQKLLDRRMYREAWQLADQAVPPLELQEMTLNFPRKNEWLELCTMYDWPEPPNLRSDVLEALHAVSAEFKDLSPLIDSYRRLIRGDDVLAKIRVLRQLAVRDANNPEWRDSLRKQEEKRFRDLAAEAKQAICNHEYPHLQEIRQELLSPEWSAKPNELVVQKIERVLENHRLEELEKLASVCLNRVNEAYGAFDCDALEKALDAWGDLLRNKGYQPGEAAQKQIAEAEEYYLEQQKIKQEKAAFDRLVQELRAGLEKEAPLPELEMLYNRILMAEQPIPEIVQKRYLSYKESVEAIARRNRLLRIAAVAAAAVVVIGAVLLTVSNVIMNSKEREWTMRLETALTKEPSAVALQLLNDLEKSSPALRKRPRIQELSARVETKHQEEEKKRRSFQKLAAKIQQELQDFSRNRNILLEDKAQAQRLIVDQTEENAYRELDHEYQLKREAYVAEQDQLYLQLIEQLRAQRREFFAALEEEDFARAAAAAAKSAELRGKALQMRDVSGSVKTGNRRHLDEAGELNDKLAQEKARSQKADTALAELRASATVADLRSRAQAFARSYPDGAGARRANVLLANLAGFGKFAPDQPANPPGNSIFTPDAEKYAKIAAPRQKLFEEMRAALEETVNNFAKNPVYALILEYEGGICDLYFASIGVKLKNWSKAGDLRKCGNLKVLSNETGGMQEAQISFNSESTQTLTVEVGGGAYQGKLLTPDKLEYKSKLDNLAPHVRWQQKLAAALQQSGGADTVETILAGACKELLAAKEINPFLRLSLARGVIGGLQKADPENATYRELAEAAAATARQIPDGFNWLLSFQSEENLEKQKQLAAELTKLAALPLTPDREKLFYKRLYAAALSRKIVPAGYVRKGKAGFELTGLRAVSNSGEIWIASEEKPYWRLIGEFAGSRLNIPEEEMRNLTEMQLLYTPTDGLSTRELTTRLIEEAKRQGVESIEWPSSWPAFAEGAK